MVGVTTIRSNILKIDENYQIYSKVGRFGLFQSIDLNNSLFSQFIALNYLLNKLLRALYISTYIIYFN